MENDRTEGQGLGFATDPETGYSRPLIGGGSDAGVAGVGDDGGSAGTVSGGEGEGVQSGEPTAPVEGGQQPTSDAGGESGQGFLEPYLNEVPEDQREVVEPILERYRQEQDANFNRRFEQLREEARIPTTIYQSLMQDPVQTLNWIADKMQEERGLDVRSQLLERWQDGQQGQPSGEQPAGEETTDKPLTQAELDRILEEREEQRQQQQREQQFQQQQVQKQQETVNNWIDDAAKKFSLELDDPEGGEDPLRAVVIMQANSLHEQGVARGQAAVEMAVETVAKRFGKTNSNGGNNKGEQPVTANGGTPPPAKEIDVSDTNQRKSRMLELFEPPTN